MKKFLAFFALVFVCLCTFAGCDLVTKDNEKYMNEVVISVGDIDITREDFLEKYNNIYYSRYNSEYQISEIYAQYYGMDYDIDTEKIAKESKEQAIESLVNSAVLEIEGRKGGELSDREMTYIWSNVFNTIESYLDDYAEEYVAKSKEDDDETTAEQSTTKNQIEFYEKKAKLEYENVSSKYNIVDLQESDLEKEISEAVETGKVNYKSDRKIIDYVNDCLNDYKYDADGDGEFDGAEDLASVKYAKKELISALRKAEDGRDFDDTSKNAVLVRKFEKLLNAEIRNLYIEKAEITMSDKLDVTLDSIVDKYADLIEINCQEYTLSDSNYKADLIGDTDSSKSADVTSVFYYMNGGDSDKYCKVTHLLIEFDSIKDGESELYDSYVDEYITALYNDYSEYVANNAERPSVDDFHIKLKNETIKVIEDLNENYFDENNQIKIYDKDEVEYNGIKIDVKTITAKDFLKLLNKEMEKAENSELTETENLLAKFKVFAEYMNLYSGDNSGIMSTSSTNNYYAYSDERDFVDEFKDAVKELWGNGSGTPAEIGTLSDLAIYYSKSSSTTAKAKDCVKGIHIIMWLGECTNLYNSEDTNYSDDIAKYRDENNKNEILKYLSEHFYNYMTGETLFDYVYEQVADDMSNNNETSLINSYRESNKIIIRDSLIEKTFD